MGFECGIVGLPNVGKSTIFRAITSAAAEAANFPFCTIEPNSGTVDVPDERLKRIAEHIPPQKLIPTSMTFVDIAGLVKGASTGEGLGNQFLGNIRSTHAIAHVVRCFEDDNITHVDGSVDPIRDIEVIEAELAIADLETATKRLKSIEKKAMSGDKAAQKAVEVLKPVIDGLNQGIPVRAQGLSKEQLAEVRDLHFLTAKAMMYVPNVSEEDIAKPEACPLYQKVKAHADKEGAACVPICGRIEAELAELDADEKAEFLADIGLEEPSLNRVIRAGYQLLKLQTYFTAGEKEVRAWTFKEGWTAPQCAGVIHTDFERGFIKAEVYHFDDLMKHKSELAIKEAGALRIEGKAYVVKDGDIMHFRFNV